MISHLEPKSKHFISHFRMSMVNMLIEDIRYVLNFKFSKLAQGHGREQGQMGHILLQAMVRHILELQHTLKFRKSCTWKYCSITIPSLSLTTMCLEMKGNQSMSPSSMPLMVKSLGRCILDFYYIAMERALISYK